MLSIAGMLTAIYIFLAIRKVKRKRGSNVETDSRNTHKEKEVRIEKVNDKKDMVVIDRGKSKIFW
jgi:hypothetical protein